MPDIKTLSTQRFTLRPLQRSDAAALFPTLSDEQQCLYLTRPVFESEEELWDWLAAPDWPGLTWIAEDADGQVAGRFVAVPAHGSSPDHGSVFEIGYITCIHRQGEGIARECTEALITHLWEGAKGFDPARKLTAEVDTRNIASVRLLERLGFVREAHLRDHDVSHIGLCDVYWYGLLRRDLG